MLIREATISDAGQIAKVNVDTWWTTYRSILPNDHLEKLSYKDRENSTKDLLRKYIQYMFQTATNDKILAENFFTQL